MGPYVNIIDLQCDSITASEEGMVGIPLEFASFSHPSGNGKHLRYQLQPRATRHPIQTPKIGMFPLQEEVEMEGWAGPAWC